ncbi:major facilitator transporter [Morganella morganii]|uniref:MFS transporter n=1 Tax=Morganella morganii TaxID=582 RepID=UPI00062C4E3D|nr:MFS transporter [Morganella morganii]KKY70901.1 major facilitator transporter [Morganella morganii]MDM8753323.1 MFS transporter [Morganella morganii]HDF2328252.1 MFS transporter [Morganella morganii]HDF2330664.1 MFS transporter [Morganella morganii]
MTTLRTHTAASATSRNKLLWIAGMGWTFDAMDVGLLAFLLAALQADWGLSASQLGWIGSLNAAGMAVGAFVFGIMADRKGRKPVFILTLLLFSLGSGLTAVAGSLAVVLVLRFFIGMGLGGELPVASTLVSESVAPHERGRVVVLLESFWAVGWLIAALIAYYVIPDYGWRTAMLLSALPALYALWLRAKLPEPVSRYTAQTRPKLTVVQSMALIWSPQYRRATLMLWILWFCVVFSYYGIFLWLPGVAILKGFSLIKSFQYVLIMTLAQLPGYFSAAWLIERYGRKFVLVTYLAGTAISAYGFSCAETATALVISGMLLSFFNLGAWGALYAYTPEQYPDSVRATGAGTATAIGRIGGILGPLLAGYLIQYQFAVSTIFLIFSAAVVIAILAVLFLGAETRNRELSTI